MQYPLNKSEKGRCLNEKSITEKYAYICSYGSLYRRYGLFAYKLVANSGDWVDQHYNYHIAGTDGLAKAGTIYDRNGNILAQSVDGKRVYNENQSVRTSLLHTIGDNSSNISTALQSRYRSQLIGYNLIWGLNMPDSLRKGNDINLTVDADTCAAAYDVLSGYGKDGACVVYNYKTGEVICSVSTKAYDPEAPPEITEENEKTTRVCILTILFLQPMRPVRFLR